MREIRSTWEPWFVQSHVEGADPDGLALWYLGCNGFVLRTSEVTVYVDPYFGPGTDRGPTVRMIPVPMDPSWANLCDAVVVTHEHTDHFHPPSYEPLLDADTDEATLYASQGTFENPSYDGEVVLDGIDDEIVAAGESFDVGDLTFHARYGNDDSPSEPLAFVVEHESGTFFHGGDGTGGDSFRSVGEEFDIDLGALAFGTAGTYYPGGPDDTRALYMDENEVIAAANQLELDRLIPTHWDMWNGFGGDPKCLHDHARTFEYPRVVEPAKIGDRLDVSRPGIVRPQP